jgi:acyl-CoA reductase-like NAD-dependent aldehyde dehydrogenase
MISMTINGSSVRGQDERAVINPSTGKPFDSVPECSAAELDAAMEAASTAFRAWRRTEEPRRAALLRAADIVTENADELARLVTLEQGKPLSKAVREVKGAGGWIRYVAGLEIKPETIHDKDGLRVEVWRQPLGVVAAITPWNYPVVVAAGKIAAALRAGNTMVLKPSPFTPLSTLRMGELLQSAFPPGVLNVISGGDDIGKAMTTHPAVRKISFTGSTEAGKHIMSSAVSDLKKATLELGGNDPAIVLDDVDPAAIAARLFWGAFQNSGQVCSAIKRLYVHERVYDEVTKALTELAATVRVGDGLDPETELGPVSTLPQFERVADLIADVSTAGGAIRIGGTRKGSEGYFFNPTLVEKLTDGSRLVAEEQFGPVLPISPFSDLDEVFERANATRFGLSGSIWSGNVARARDLAGELDCGTVWINQHLTVIPAAPVAGHKWSGMGVEHGVAGLMEFMQIQTRAFPSDA